MRKICIPFTLMHMFVRIHWCVCMIIIRRQKTCRLDSYKLLLTIKLPTNQSNKLYRKMYTHTNTKKSAYMHVCMYVFQHYRSQRQSDPEQGNDSNEQYATDANARQMEAWRIHINCSTSKCYMRVCV